MKMIAMKKAQKTMIREESNNTVKEVQKSQSVRLIDVFFIAPYLLYVSSKSQLTRLDKNLLFVLGVATLYYNGINYMKNKKK